MGPRIEEGLFDSIGVAGLDDYSLVGVVTGGEIGGTVWLEASVEVPDSMALAIAVGGTEPVVVSSQDEEATIVPSGDDGSGLLIAPLTKDELDALHDGDPGNAIVVTTEYGIDELIESAREGLVPGEQVVTMLRSLHEAGESERWADIVKRAGVATCATWTVKHGLDYIRSGEKKDLAKAGVSAAATIFCAFVRRQHLAEAEESRSYAVFLAKRNGLDLPKELAHTPNLG